MGRSDIFGRVMGMLVFLGGIALLGFVFYIAYNLFITPPAAALGLTFIGDPKKDPPALNIGVVAVGLLLRIGYLFLMSIAGSLIANKGIHLYFSAMQGGVTLPKKKTETPEPPASP